MIDREIFTIVIILIAFFILGIFAGSFMQETDCEKLAVDLQHYPKCQVVKYPLYCVRQYIKLKDLERQIDNDR